MYIKTLVFDDNTEALASGCLVSITKEIAILELEADACFDKLIYGSKIRLKVLDHDNGVITYIGTIASIDLLTLILKVKDLEKLDVVQRREDVKAYVNYNSTISYHLDGASRVFNINVRDVSSGGMGFSSKEDLPIEVIYSNVLPFTKLPLIVKLKIVRKQAKDSKNIFLYGCRYVNLKPEEEALIRAFVFSSQIKQRRIMPKDMEEV